MFCRLNSFCGEGVYSFNITSSFFYYKERKFTIIQHAKTMYLYQNNNHLPFLYSGQQTLNINSITETYDLKFKIGEYNNEQLLMKGKGDGIISLDNCSVKEKELICKIGKEYIEEFAVENGEKFQISFFIPGSGSGAYDETIYSIYGIYINYPIKKKDIKVEIINILEKKIDMNNYISYGTNVTNITNVYSYFFSLDFSDTYFFCNLKKTEVTPLLVICKIDLEGEFSLKKENMEKRLYNINIKYNFFIQPINNYEKFKCSGKGSYMIFNLPRVLDFTLSNRINIYYKIWETFDTKKFILNPDSNDLDCIDYTNSLKRCTVDKSHFNYKNSGIYYTYHLNHAKNLLNFMNPHPLKLFFQKYILK